MATLTLNQLVNCVQELPPLPDTALKVLKMADDPAISARDIGHTISADIALTSQLLKIANSAYYGMPRKVSTVSEAVLILGMQALRNLALAAAACDTLKREMPGYCMAAGELWQHSIICAITAQLIARRTKAVRIEEAFVAGLLHDVGKVVLNIHVEHQFQAILALAELDAMPFHEAEKCVLGFDHAEVGAQVAEKWNLPSSLCSAIAGHHCLDRGSATPELTAIIYLANALCNAEGLPLGSVQLPADIHPAALQRLNLSEHDLVCLMEEMTIEIGRAQNMFDI